MGINPEAIANKFERPHPVQVEGTPRLPFGGFVRDLRRVELSLRLRRRRLLAALEDDEILPTVTTFPLMV